MRRARTMLLTYSLGVLLWSSGAQLAPSGAPIMISRVGMRSPELPSSLAAMIAAIDEALVVVIDNSEPPCAALEAAEALFA